MTTATCADFESAFVTFTRPLIVLPSIVHSCSVEVPSIRTKLPVAGAYRSVAKAATAAMRRRRTCGARFMVMSSSRLTRSEGEGDFRNESLEAGVAVGLHAVVDDVARHEAAV